MKKILTTSIFVLILNIAWLIFNGVLSFVFLVAFDLAASLSGEIPSGQIPVILALLAIIMILNLANIVGAIISIIKYRKNSLGSKKVLIFDIISILLTVIANVVFVILTFGSGVVWITLALILVHLIFIIILISEIKKSNSDVSMVSDIR